MQDKLVAASHFLEHVAKDFFLPGHMGGGLVLGLTVISVEGSMSNSFRLCRLGRGQENFKTMYHLDVLCLKSIKFPFSKKKERKHESGVRTQLV